jgi:hypothetical protein
VLPPNNSFSVGVSISADVTGSVGMEEGEEVGEKGSK